MGRKRGTLIYQIPAELAKSFENDFHSYGISGDLVTSHGTVLYTGVKFEDFEKALSEYLEKNSIDEVDVITVPERYSSIFDERYSDMEIILNMRVFERQFPTGEDREYNVVKRISLDLSDPSGITSCMNDIRSKVIGTEELKRRIKFTGYIDFDGKKTPIKTTKPRKPNNIARRLERATKSLAKKKK